MADSQMQTKSNLINMRRGFTVLLLSSLDSGTAWTTYKLSYEEIDCGAAEDKCKFLLDKIIIFRPSQLSLHNPRHDMIVKVGESTPLEFRLLLQKKLQNFQLPAACVSKLISLDSRASGLFSNGSQASIPLEIPQLEHHNHVVCFCRR